MKYCKLVPSRGIKRQEAKESCIMRHFTIFTPCQILAWGTRTQPSTHMRKPAHPHARTHAHTHAHTRACAHTYTHTHTHKETACMCTFVHLTMRSPSGPDHIKLIHQFCPCRDQHSFCHTLGCFNYPCTKGCSVIHRL